MISQILADENFDKFELGDNVIVKSVFLEMVGFGSHFFA